MGSSPARCFGSILLCDIVVTLCLLCEGIDTSDPNAVVVGLAPDHFNYQTLNKAFR